MPKEYGVKFSVGQYDCDGDQFDAGILLHINGGGFIIRVKDGDELDALIASLVKCRNEMSGAWGVKYSEPRPLFVVSKDQE